MNTFIIQLWEEDEEHLYFQLRKIRKTEEDKLNSIQGVIEQMKQIFGYRRIFSIQYEKRTRKIEGIFYDDNDQGATRLIDETEREGIEKFVRRFIIRKAFTAPSARNKNAKTLFVELKRVIEIFEGSLKRLKEWVDLYQPTQEEMNVNYQNLRKDARENKASIQLTEKLIFQLQTYYVFNPP